MRSFASLPEIESVDVRVCGIKGHSLVPLDVEFDEPEPIFLVFDTLAWLLEHRRDFDYYVLVEDDILVSPDVLANTIAFDRVSQMNEVLHPNRIEVDKGVAYNTDLRTYGQWTTQHKFLNGKRLVVNANPHAAIFVLSAEKLNYCAEHANLKLRGLFQIGEFHGGMMASAFANFLSPLSLFRSYDDLAFNRVIHQDKFEPFYPTLYNKASAIAHAALPASLVDAIKRWKGRLSRFKQ